MSRLKTLSLVSFSWFLLSSVLPAESIILTERPEYVRPDLRDVPPVNLQFWLNNNPINVSLVRPDAEGIEIELRDRPGAFVVYWEFMEQFRISMPQTPEMATIERMRSPQRRADALAPIVEPLFPLAAMPEPSTNIHRFINQYLEALVEAQRWETLQELSTRLFLDRIPASIVTPFFTASRNLFILGEEEAGLKLLDTLIAARPIEEARANSLEIGGQFLRDRLFLPALRLFSTFTGTASGAEGKRLLLICAYLSLELEEFEKAQAFLDTAERIEVDEDDRQVSAVQRLVRGVQLHKQGQYNAALTDLGYALSILSATDSLRVVALFYNHQSYHNLEQEAIADSIFAEMRLLFGRSAYTTSLIPADESVDLSEAAIEEI